MLILYLESRGFTEQSLAPNTSDSTINTRFATFLHKTVVIPNYNLDLDPHVKNIPHTEAYLEFIDSLIRYVIAAKLPNSLAYGYSDPVALAWSSGTANSYTSFAANTLKSALWHLLYEKIGKSEFVRLVLGSTCYQLAPSGMYVQVFGVSSKFAGAAKKRLQPKHFTMTGTLVPATLTAFVKEVTYDETLTKKHRPLRQLCDLVMKNFHKCQYACIFKSIMGPAYMTGDHYEVKAVSVNKVVDYMLVVCTKLFPNIVWGNAYNKSIIRKATVQYVITGNRAIYSLVVPTNKFSITSINWLGGHKTTSLQDFENRKIIFTQFLDWYFNGFIRRLLSRQWQLVYQSSISGSPFMEYYPRKAYTNASDQWLQGYKSSFLYESSSLTDFKSATNNFVGSIKLLPKSDGFRMLCVPLKTLPLIVEKDTKDMAIRYAMLMKQIVKPVQFLLNHRDKLRYTSLAARHPRCHSVNEVFSHLQNYRKRLGGRKVFGLKFDMSKCYDNMDHERLMACIQNLFADEDQSSKFYVRQYAEKFIYSKKKEKPTFRVNKEDSIAQFDAMRPAAPIDNPRSKAVVDKCYTRVFTVDEVLQFVDSYIKDSAIMISKKSVQLYKRTRGVFQGFPLSATLCNLYYNQIVDTELGFLLTEEPQSLFLRLADDFLFLSTDKAQVDRVYKVVNGEQFQKYGGFVNDTKTIWIGDNSDEFVFVGLTIDPKTLNASRTFNDVANGIASNTKSYKSAFSSLSWWFNSQMRYLVSVELESFERQLANIKHIVQLLVQALIKISKKMDKLNEDIPELELQVFTYTTLDVLVESWKAQNNDLYNDLLIFQFKSCFFDQKKNKLIKLAYRTLKYL